jgi:XTP/dITP diphosphohydrolase
MHVVIATANSGKFAEFQEGLYPLPWTLSASSQHGLPLPPETGSTYEENAVLKATTIAHMGRCVALADDSGLEVAALDGEPGVYSARYGDKSNDMERVLFLLEKIKRVAPPRAAKFVSVLALAYPNGHVETFRGEVAGELLEGPRGQGGFGYDPIFLYPPLGRTFAELTLAEKRHISHRGQALAKLIQSFKDRGVQLRTPAT